MKKQVIGIQMALASFSLMTWREYNLTLFLGMFVFFILLFVVLLVDYILFYTKGDTSIVIKNVTIQKENTEQSLEG